MFRQFLSNFITTRRALVCRIRRHGRGRALQRASRRRNIATKFAGPCRFWSVGDAIRCKLIIRRPTSAMRCLAVLFITAASSRRTGRSWKDFSSVLLRKTVIVNIASPRATKREFDWTKCAFGALLVDAFHERRRGTARRREARRSEEPGKRCILARKSDHR